MEIKRFDKLNNDSKYDLLVKQIDRYIDSLENLKNRLKLKENYVDNIKNYDTYIDRLLQEYSGKQQAIAKERDFNFLISFGFCVSKKMYIR